MSNKLKGFASHPNNIEKDCYGNRRYKSLLTQARRCQLTIFNRCTHFGSKPLAKLLQLIHV